MANKLIVLSVDSLFDEDMDQLAGLPNIGRLIRRGSYVRGGMRSVYPSFTYPAHASIITGCWPQAHGIYHNERLNVGGPSPGWYWFHRDLKRETLLDAAHRAGLTTACVGWPCMGGAQNVDWLVPEIWPPTAEEDPRPVLASAASPDMLAPGGVLERHWHKLRKTKQPHMDHMMVGCACDIIRRYQPDVMFIHLSHLDHTRHANGVHGPAPEMAVIQNDDWFGRIEEAAMDAGVYEQTNFAVISDHGHLPVKQMFNPNVLLAQAGLITLDDDGEITGWRAYCNSTSLSCQVVMKDPGDDETRAELEALLTRMRRTYEYGVEAVYTREEVLTEQHLDGAFAYVLEGARSTSFGAACTGPAIVTPDNSDYKFSVSSHGHLPHKGPQPVFLVAGPDIRPGVALPRQRIIDEAPTFARILGFPLPQAQGRCMEGLLKDK